MNNSVEGPWTDSFGGVGESLAAMGNVGLTPTHLKVIRSNPAAARAAVDAIDPFVDNLYLDEVAPQPCAYPK